MIPKIIVGLGHRSGVGKDTLAKFLDGQIRVKQPGVTCRVVPFAWKLKQICYELYAWAGVRQPIHYENHREDRNLPLNLPGGPTVVDLWVMMGADAIRNNVYDATWIDFVIKGMHEQLDVVIVPDVRFPNEAQKLREAGAILIRVDNPRIPPREGKSVDDKLSDWTDWDRIFVNDGEGLKSVMDYADTLSDLVLERL